MFDTNLTSIVIPEEIKKYECQGIKCPNYYLAQEDIYRGLVKIENDICIPEGVIKIGDEYITLIHDDK